MRHEDRLAGQRRFNTASDRRERRTTASGDVGFSAFDDTAMWEARDVHEAGAYRRLSSKRVIVVCVVCAVLVWGVLALGEAYEGAGGGAGGPSAAAHLQQSTPRDEWSAGAIPFIYQTDPEWANAPYANDTVALSGCGPTCMSMLYVWKTGARNMDPAKMCEWAEREGYVDSGMTSWLFMTDGAQRLGLQSRELPADEQMIKNELAAGNPIVATVGPGDFTTKGHFIVLASLDDDGMVLVHDPNSSENSSKAWDIHRICSQARNFWVFPAS